MKHSVLAHYIHYCKAGNQCCFRCFVVAWVWAGEHSGIVSSSEVAKSFLVFAITDLTGEGLSNSLTVTAEV